MGCSLKLSLHPNFPCESFNHSPPIKKFQWLQDKLLNDEKRNINTINHVLSNFKDEKINNNYFVMVISGEKKESGPAAS